MMGVYKIVNKTNQKIYVGIAFNIEKRWKEHKQYAFKNCDDSYHKNRLYTAIRKYGLDRFEFSIIEECPKHELKEREKYWIDYYDSYNKGYNMTTGGDISGYDLQGENHPNAKLTEADVIEIRKRYAKLERRSEVYKSYQKKIRLKGFVNVWLGITWPNIMPEVYTPENAEYHAKNTGSLGSKNSRAKITESDVLEIRNRRNNGEVMKEVHKSYSDKFSLGYFKNIWYGNTWKNVN